MAHGKQAKNTENPWQNKLYNKPIFKRIFDAIIPRKGTKEYRKITRLLKDTASKQKIEWLYINRVCTAIATFIISIILFGQMHKIAIDYVYTEPTSDFNIIGTMSESDKKKGMKITEQDNVLLDKLKGNSKITKEEILKAVKKSDAYKDLTEAEQSTVTDRIYTKLQTINSETMQWFDLMLAIVFAILRIQCTSMDANVPKENEANGNGRRSNAIPNYNFNVNENREGKCRNNIRVA